MDENLLIKIDKKGREIIIEEDVTSIVAKHNGKTIGRFEFDNNDSGILLFNCSIDDDYQQCGIGREIMKLAEDIYGKFCIVNHLSIEGALFITYCECNKVFKYDHLLIDDDRY